VRQLAHVRFDGEEIYLGEHGTQESLEEYRRLVLDWLRVNQLAPQQRSLAVDELELRYLEHADRYYVKNGEPTNEPHNIRLATQHQIGRTALDPVAWYYARAGFWPQGIVFGSRGNDRIGLCENQHQSDGWSAETDL
jgi:hypothetical protein